MKNKNYNKVKGEHYDKCGCETIVIIENVVNRENIPRKAAYNIGNAIKYLLRLGLKQGESWEEDVAKAENYLHRARTGEWSLKK